MNEAESIIKLFVRQIMWRMRLLTLLDRLALMILVGCLVSAGFVLFARLKPGGRIYWPVLIVLLAVVLSAFLFNWIKTRASERDSAFAIDNTLGLEDRIITAHEIVGQPGPKKVVETALIEDAAGRIRDRRASSVIAYGFKKSHALTLAGIVLLTAAILIPEKALPGGEAIAEARADIQAAGEQLEQAATEAEQIAPAESETAGLAKEQAELGRSFRRSSESRAEALKKLSSLENRIRQRHDVLAETRADEIVNIAEQRLRTAVSTIPKPRSKPASSDDDEAREQAANSSDPASSDPASSDPASGDAKSTADRKATQPNASGGLKRQPATPSSKSDKASVSPNSTATRNSSAGDPATAQRSGRGGVQQQANTNQSSARSELATGTPPDSQGQAGKPVTQDGLQKPVPSGGAQSSAANKNSSAATKEGDTQASSGEDASAQKEAGQKESGEKKEASEGEQKPDGNQRDGDQAVPPIPNGLGGMVAEQAAKALPQMSQDLLNKAAQMRAGQLTAEDIKRLAQTAQFLAQDLKQIAQSKAFQEALEQMARQISPEQIEQVARLLMNQEQLKRELEAAARLMMQNQQAKEMVAGIKQSVEDLAKQFGGRDGMEKRNRSRGAGGDGAQDGKSGPSKNSRLQLERADSQKLKGQGKESNVSGNLRRGTDGEYLYLRTRAGAGAARAPYSSAYPQYRREAERSVQRSAVPPHMRSMVRSYFDAINPDAAKKP
jgi:hypothetical protein